MSYQRHETIKESTRGESASSCFSYTGYIRGNTRRTGHGNAGPVSFGWRRRRSCDRRRSCGRRRREARRNRLVQQTAPQWDRRGRTVVVTADTRDNVGNSNGPEPRCCHRLATRSNRRKLSQVCLVVEGQSVGPRSVSLHRQRQAGERRGARHVRWLLGLVLHLLRLRLCCH